MSNADGLLFEPLQLPCGFTLGNRIIKSAMSDSLGDGCGQPTETQMRLYERWADGGVAASIVGEVQLSSRFAEKPGNLVLDADADAGKFESLARRGSSDASALWLQLSHAGAMAYPPISTPKGPSALDIPGLQCDALSLDEVQALPDKFARAAERAQQLGFGGVEIHAAHGFLLSQFLSPLFNQRTDAYGGSIDARMRLLLEVIEAVRARVPEHFVVAVKLNSSDQLEGGFEEEESLSVIRALDGTGVDLLDISGGTYFPGATSASDSAGRGPYFLDFASRARPLTSIPLMVTGGFKTRRQVIDALGSGHVDAVGLARTLVLEPELLQRWRSTESDPVFPVFDSPPEGGVTAWYTMRLTEIGNDAVCESTPDLSASILEYEARDRLRTETWNDHFNH